MFGMVVVVHIKIKLNRTYISGDLICVLDFDDVFLVLPLVLYTRITEISY
jgi:hypothetical protein